MKFFCPRCRTTLSGASSDEGPRDSSHVTCPGCGFIVDLALADTAAGQPTLPIERDFSGEHVDGLTLESCLGSGGMGTVYRAVDETSGQRVAVKMMFPQFAAQPDLVERFRREAGALRELSHPGIVGYRGEGEIEGRYYIVMELVDGQNLEDVMAAGVMPVERVADVAIGICAALEAAHAKGIVHRDLKPANIILAADGVKVLDFGIAQVSIDDLTLTRSDAVLGTFNYMAPEQRIGARDIDHRADLFSLGVILYRMLTGRLPIGVFEPPSRHTPGLGGGWDRLVSRLLSAEPDGRHADAAAVRRDLEALAHGGGERRVVAFAAAAVLLIALAGIAAYGLLPDAKKVDEDTVGQKAAEAPVETLVNVPEVESEQQGGVQAQSQAAAAPQAQTKEPPPINPIDLPENRKQKIPPKKRRAIKKSPKNESMDAQADNLDFGSFSKGVRNVDSKNVDVEQAPQQKQQAVEPTKEPVTKEPPKKKRLRKKPRAMLTLD